MEMYQFQVGYMYYPTLKQNRSFKEQVEIFCLKNLILQLKHKQGKQ